MDEASKLDVLESFAMELFLTSVIPRHARHLRRDCDQHDDVDSHCSLCAPPQACGALRKRRRTRHCTCRVEAVLVQNQCFDVWHDDLASLAEEDAPAASGNSATLLELQSFTEMSYSQGRCVAALQWVPARKVLLTNRCRCPAQDPNLSAQPKCPAYHVSPRSSLQDMMPKTLGSCLVGDCCPLKKAFKVALCGGRRAP